MIVGQVVLAVAGVGLVLLAILDAVVTTLSVASGAGPVTGVTARVTWRAMLRYHRSRTAHRLLVAGGPTLLVLALVQWVLLLWGGWALVLLADPGSLVDSSTGVPADAADRFYFAGVSVFTLGTGDVVGTSAAWRVLSVAIAATGLFVVTLALSYFTSVAGAAAGRRALGARLAALGPTPVDLVAAATRDGELESGFTSQVSSLLSSITRVTEQHLAYPVLHFFHASERDVSAVVALARLDEALTLLGVGVPGADLGAEPLRSVSASLGRMVEVVGRSHPPADDQRVPPLPDLAAVRARGVQLAPDDVVTAGFHQRDARRRQWAALVASDGWDWDDVLATPPVSEPDRRSTAAGAARR